MTTLARCGRCGRYPTIIEKSARVSVECLDSINCGVAGPWADSLEKAVGAWNILNDPARAVGWKAAVDAASAAVTNLHQEFTRQELHVKAGVIEFALLRMLILPPTDYADPTDSLRQERDALSAENARLREALKVIAELPLSDGTQDDMLAANMRKIARDALGNKP